MKSLVAWILLPGILALARADPEPYNGCPRGYHIGYSGRCEPTPPPPPRNEYDYDRRRPYRPQELVQPTPQSCEPGYKLSRGVCSKMTDREIELDRLPKEPCPPGERRARLVCRPYN